MQPPHRRGEGGRGHPWVNGFPAPERARGHAPAETAGNGAQTLQPWRGEPHVTRRPLDGLQAKPLRSLWGLWLQRPTARGTLRQEQRRDGAPSESPAPRQAGGEGRSGPPPARADVRCAGTAGGPTGREPEGHGAAVGVGGRASRPQGADHPRAPGRRLPGKAGGRVGVIPQAFPGLSMGTGEPDASQGARPVRRGAGSKGG